MKTDQEYMVRWKRTAKNRWYYCPKVYDNKAEAIAMASRSSASLYRAEVVVLNPVQCWGSNDSVQ